ncbi:unnamed protein product, partial [Ceratitis capitata]
MPCSFPKCAIKGDSDRFVACWLCNVLTHQKCSGLTARIVDVLAIAIVFCGHVQTRIGFSEIGRELSTLKEKFKHYD